MSWPEQTLSLPMQEWQRRVERRGRAIRRRRRALAAAVTGATLSAVIVPIAVLYPSAASAPNQLRVVTPAIKPGPATRVHDSGRSDQVVAPRGQEAASRPAAGAPTVTQTLPRLSAVPSYASPPFAENRSLNCATSHFGTSSCAGSSVGLDPQTGLLAPKAVVQTGNGGTDSDWGANDTATGAVKLTLRLTQPRQQEVVVVHYRLASSPTVTTSPGNSGSNSLLVTATPRACQDCAGTTTTALASGAASGTTGTLSLTLTNPYGDVPAGLIDVVVRVQSFATIGTCNAPCGQPGNGSARAAVAVNIQRVSLR